MTEGNKVKTYFQNNSIFYWTEKWTHHAYIYPFTKVLYPMLMRQTVLYCRKNRLRALRSLGLRACNNFWGQATNTCKCRGSWSWPCCEKLKLGRTRMESAKCCVAFWWRCRAATVPFGSSAFSFSCLFYSSRAVTANLTLYRWKRQQFGWKLLQQFADFRCALHFIKVYFVRGNPFWILFQRIPY